MIFVTVGTHEQQFNRLIRYVDELCGKKIINEEVYIQTGYSEYEPKNCKWSKFISYEEMINKIEEARIVITHGGPASFIMPLQIGKIPIVVPRQEKFKEHVNDHQVDFTEQVYEKMKNIILVLNITELQDKIINYYKLIENINKQNNSNNLLFCKEFDKIVKEIIN